MQQEAAIDVNFGSGKELLTSYWGYLTGGGLIISDPGIEVGELVSMQVTISSSSSKYRLRGTVVKREPDSARAIIAFRPGEAHDMLLSEALAESDNVAPRRFARFMVDAEVTTAAGGRDLRSKLVNLSKEGCCLTLEKHDVAALDIDTEVVIVHGEIHAVGTVVWRRHLERGLRMSADEALPLLQELCGDIA